MLKHEWDNEINDFSCKDRWSFIIKWWWNHDELSKIYFHFWSQVSSFKKKSYQDVNENIVANAIQSRFMSWMLYHIWFAVSDHAQW